MGKVPALADGEAMVAESGAIYACLAERFPEAELAPPLGDPLRGRYLQWLFFAAGCLEPLSGGQACSRTKAAMRGLISSRQRRPLKMP